MSEVPAWMFWAGLVWSVVIVLAMARSLRR